MSNDILQKVAATKSVFEQYDLNIGSECFINGGNATKEAYSGFDIDYQSCNARLDEDFVFKDIKLKSTDNGVKESIVCSMNGCDLDFELQIDSKNNKLAFDYDMASSMTVAVNVMKSLSEEASLTQRLKYFISDNSISINEISANRDFELKDFVEPDELNGMDEDAFYEMFGFSQSDAILPEQFVDLINSMKFSLDKYFEETEGNRDDATYLLAESVSGYRGDIGSDEVFNIMEEVGSDNFVKFFEEDYLDFVKSSTEDISWLNKEYVITPSTYEEASSNFIEKVSQLGYDSALSVEVLANQDSANIDVTLCAGGPGVSYKLDCDSDGDLNKISVITSWGFGSTEFEVYESSIKEYIEEYYSKPISEMELDGHCSSFGM